MSCFLRPLCAVTIIELTGSPVLPEAMESSHTRGLGTALDAGTEARDPGQGRHPASDQPCTECPAQLHSAPGGKSRDVRSATQDTHRPRARSDGQAERRVRLACDAKRRVDPRVGEACQGASSFGHTEKRLLERHQWTCRGASCQEGHPKRAKQRARCRGRKARRARAFSSG